MHPSRRGWALDTWWALDTYTTVVPEYRSQLSYINFTVPDKFLLETILFCTLMKVEASHQTVCICVAIAVGPRLLGHRPGGVTPAALEE